MRPTWELNDATPQAASSAAEVSLPSELPLESPVPMPTTEPVDAPPIEWRKEFEFSGVLALVPEHREKVMEFVDLHCPDEGDRIDWLVAVQEALANAALHGCHDDPSKMTRARAFLWIEPTRRSTR